MCAFKQGLCGFDSNLKYCGITPEHMCVKKTNLNN